MSRIMEDKYNYGVFDVEEPIRAAGRLFDLKDTVPLKNLVTESGVYWRSCLDRHLKYSEHSTVVILGVSSKMEVDEMVKRNSHFLEITGGVSRNGCPDLLSDYVRKNSYMRKIHNNLNRVELVEKINNLIFDIRNAN